MLKQAKQFQSAPPAREATRGRGFPADIRDVSIRAPRAGGDPRSRARRLPWRCFNPRPPRGRRPGRASGKRGASRFNPRPPRGRRRRSPSLTSRAWVFQSAPPAREATGAVIRWFLYRVGFNPRPPRGRRRLGDIPETPVVVFQSAPPAREATPRQGRAGGRVCVSIRAPRAGGDQVAVGEPSCVNVSIRAPRAGGDTRRMVMLSPSISFNPRPPRGRRRWRAGCPAGCSTFQSAPPAREATP